MSKTYEVRCGHPLHVERFKEPNWHDGVLVRHTKPGAVPLVVFCGGCADVDSREGAGDEPPTIEKQVAELRSEIEVLKGGVR